jgi:hypothetical protein
VLLIGWDIAINTVLYQMFDYTSGIAVIPSIYVALNKLYGMHYSPLPRSNNIYFYAATFPYLSFGLLKQYHYLQLSANRA